MFQQPLLGFFIRYKNCNQNVISNYCALIQLITGYYIWQIGKKDCHKWPIYLMINSTGIFLFIALSMVDRRILTIKVQFTNFINISR
jgi:hypothetical protein